MTPLKKYIRPGVLRNLLRKAHNLAGRDCALAISYEGEVVIIEGTDSVEGLGENDPGVITSPLQFDDIHAGAVCMRPPADCSESRIAQCREILSFIAYSIQELMDMERARRSIAEEALSKYRELALLHRSVPNINTSLHMRDVVKALMDECRLENYPGEMGMIYLRVPGSKRYRAAVQSGFPFGTNLQPMVHSLLFMDVVDNCRGEIVNDLSLDQRWDGEIPGLGALIAIPIVSPNRCEGVLVLASENTGVFEASHRKSLSTLASVAGISVSNAFNFEGIQRLMDAILQALAEAIDSRDPFTAGHSKRVANLAVAFASTLTEDKRFADVSFSDEELREIYYAGILHDVGKIGIKEDVLTKNSRLNQRRLDTVKARFQLMSRLTDFDWAKAFECVCNVNKAMTPHEDELKYIKDLGKMFLESGESRLPLIYDDEMENLLLAYGNLTTEERREIQRHPAESERILQHIPMHEEYSNMLTIIRQHHERMDGSGYPDRLAGEDILMQSRMMAIVDIYDAVTQERHYKPACTRSEAVKILRKEAEEGKLDGGLTEFFLENIERIEELSERVKSTRMAILTDIGNLSSM